MNSSLFHVKQYEKNLPIYEKLYKLQDEYNQHTNITRISSKEDYYIKHIEDSLALLPYIEESGKLIDVGTGGGYPGIPLAIERPQLQVTLNDSINKKVRYLQSVIDQLPLTNATAIWDRAEKINLLPEHKGQYHYATARAVAQIDILLKYLAPFLRPHGQIILMKAKTAQEEISKAGNIAKKLNLKLVHVEKYQIEDMDRAIVIYQRQK